MNDHYISTKQGYISTKQAAEILHIDTSTLRKWHSQGRLTTVRIKGTLGGHRKWNEEDIVRLAKKLKEGKTPSKFSAPSRPALKYLYHTGRSIVTVGLALVVFGIVSMFINQTFAPNDGSSWGSNLTAIGIMIIPLGVVALCLTAGIEAIWPSKKMDSHSSK